MSTITCFQLLTNYAESSSKSKEPIGGGIVPPTELKTQFQLLTHYSKSNSKS